MDKLEDVNENHTIVSSENDMFNAFTGNGGIVVGGLYFVYGAPGSSKSTLAQWLLLSVTKNANNLGIFISNEQDKIAIKENCKRLSPSSSFFISNEKDIGDIKGATLDVANKNVGKQIWLVVDSLQGVSDRERRAKAGIDVHIVQELKTFCETNKIICLLIGQVTKTGQFSGKNGVLHNVDVEIAVLADSKFIRSIAIKKNRFGASGNQLRLNLADSKFELMPEKSVMELDFSRKEDEALMPEAMKLLKQNTVAGKMVRWTLRQGGNAMKKAVVAGVKDIFKKKKKR